ncbi:hypothetical protein VTL71DRAFT_10906 [Oculimacula yallundae]|uniref:Uncharacterized protein n=1 Tax=Oculimacula yallundae TaxID=86028 RepID=A0ABR4CUF3_9HELO
MLQSIAHLVVGIILKGVEDDYSLDNHVLNQIEPRHREEDPKLKLFSVIESAIFLTQEMQDEGKPCPTKFLSLLDCTMQKRLYEKPLSPVQRRLAQRGLSWVTEAMYTILEHEAIGILYARPYDLIRTPESKYPYLPSEDDFSFLTITLHLLDYVKHRIVAEPLLGQNSKGRPYFIMLWHTHNGFTRECFGYDKWTPWQSALRVVLGSAVVSDDRVADDEAFGHGMRWNLLEVFRDLLDSKPDVSVVTWHKSWEIPDESYTVSETVAFVFWERIPEETKELLKLVKELADSQGCALYSPEPKLNPYVEEAVAWAKKLTI